MWLNNLGLISEIQHEVNDIDPTVSVSFICTCDKDISYDDKLHISHSSIVLLKSYFSTRLQKPIKMAKKKKVEEKKEGPTSLFILRESNLIRRLTKFLIEWPPFEYTVLVSAL